MSIGSSLLMISQHFCYVCNGSSPRIERLDFNATLPGNVSEKECKKKQQYQKLRKKTLNQETVGA